MKATDPNLLVEIQGDRIVITLPGTKFQWCTESGSTRLGLGSSHQTMTVTTAKILSQGQTS